jgi:hypothetical protein
MVDDANHELCHTMLYGLKAMVYYMDGVVGSMVDALKTKGAVLFCLLLSAPLYRFP